MSRAFRFATIGVIWIAAAACHWFGVTYFAPGNGEIFMLAADGVGTFVDGGWREQQYRVFAQYIPLIMVGGSLVWGFAKEYEDAVVGTRVRP